MVMDRCYPWGDSINILPKDAFQWEEMRAKWNLTDLTAQDLYDLMKYLLKVDEEAYKWKERYD
jgi:hypothetical protein